MTRLVALLCALLFSGCETSATGSGNAKPDRTDLSADEHLVFFPTSGWLDEAGQQWHLPIHGWIYEPQDSSVRIQAFTEVLETKFDLRPDEATQTNLERRLNLLLADNERSKNVVINIAGRSIALSPSAENGQFHQTISLPLSDVSKHALDGQLTYFAVMPDGESRSFSGQVALLSPTGVSVISDIDDTVKITNVTDKRSLLRHTFFLDFIAAEGMAERYSTWARKSVAFHYVSSSPWQLYSPLSEFLDEHGFPWATFSLKPLRFRDETLLDLFKEGIETKPGAIRTILDQYPARLFVLVGDSGEQDPEVYSMLLRERGTQISRVYIRNVTGEVANNDRFRSLFGDLDRERWQLFDTPETLALPSQR